ncbi:putative RNA methyltransferase [Microtetraspora sp. NBRC 13810]|uniref:putative RNA methyltransferase n=1 Tax=Microtetraspora sp. NBRC 13810 TaxID=3030990 RepID=UPI002555EFA5|nr:methyltransferase domain-containing protein [Microtetraspora sp. NBRC 13810]
MGGVLGDVIELLVCPICRGALTLAGGAARCAGGHGFDVARQGYVSLLVGSRAPGTADSAEMVAARHDFLAAGHYDPLAARLAEAVRAALPDAGGVVLDAGAGTGHYLSAVLTGGAGETSRGIAMDVSKHAARRAARARGRIGAVVADVWRPLPVRDAAVDVVVNVFAPRNGPEFARVLRPEGRLVVVTPAPDHLEPLVGRLGLLSVDEDKERRVGESLRGGFTEVERRHEEFVLELGPDQVAAVVGMGPSAWHHDPGALRTEIEALGDPVRVRASFHLSIFQPALRSSL